MSNCVYLFIYVHLIKIASIWMLWYIVGNEVLGSPSWGLIYQSLITKDGDSDPLHPKSSNLGTDLVTDHIQWLSSVLGVGGIKSCLLPLCDNSADSLASGGLARVSVTNPEAHQLSWLLPFFFNPSYNIWIPPSSCHNSLTYKTWPKTAY